MIYGGGKVRERRSPFKTSNHFPFAKRIRNCVCCQVLMVELLRFHPTRYNIRLRPALLGAVGLMEGNHAN